MADAEKPEGRQGVARIEAFSDGVLAIIITIMVLELKAPEEDGLPALWRLWPMFLAYVLSYAYIAIYWVNHHRLFSHARTVTSALVWSNIALLFAVSLVPFATAYLGEHLFSPAAAMLYLGSLLVPAIAYFWLETVVQRTGSQSPGSLIYYRATSRKGIASVIVYALGIPLSLLSPALGIACAALVALFWMMPWGPLDRLFLRCELPEDR